MSRFCKDAPETINGGGGWVEEPGKESSGARGVSYFMAYLSGDAKAFYQTDYFFDEK